MKVAVTVVPPAATVTVHGLVLHPGPESVAADPVWEVAVTVTCVPRGITAEHVGPQFRLPPPAQVAVTVPAPFPPLLMLKLAFLSPKVAVTVVAAAIEDTVHIAPFVVVHPVQDLKSESVPGFAVRVMVEPLSKLDTQLALAQLTPDPVTVPFPLTCTVRGYFLRTKATVTVVAALIEVTLQIAPFVDEHPVHDENRYSAAGAAVSATLVPESSEVAHGNVVQFTPVPVTVPAPLACTVSAYFTRLKVATTVVPPAGTVTWQLPAPMHGPENASVDSAAGVPWTVTTVP